jgi:hypothetical protein
VAKGICNQLLHYRYEEDPMLGHRLYREIRQVEYVKEQTRKSKGRGVISVPVVSYQWETVATNFAEFEAAAVSLIFFSYASLGLLLLNGVLELFLICPRTCTQ